MRAICQSNTGAALPGGARSRGESDKTEFAPLRVGAEYTVYGLMFMSNRVDFLVCPDGTGPYWMPGNLFTVFDSALPSWRIRLPGQLEDYEELFAIFGITALVGYGELVDDYQHYVGILERDPLHLQRFFTEKQTIDRWHKAGQDGFPKTEFS
jgi:hypothetical protein